MSVAAKFEAALKQGMALLHEDEWAVANAREVTLASLSSHECFSGISGVLELAARQDDPYEFSSCCWFILDLARKADTSELPIEAMNHLAQLEAQAQKLGAEAQHELESIYVWFRLPPNKSFKADAVPARP